MMESMLRRAVLVFVVIASGCAAPGGHASAPAPATVSASGVRGAGEAPTVTMPASTVPTADGVTTTTPIAPASTSLEFDIDSGGRHRSSIVHLPTLTPGAQVPLLMALHGAGSDAARFEAKTGFDQIADLEPMVVVYPEGTQIGSTETARAWNAGQCCAPASTAGVDDEAFLATLLDRLEVVYPIDPRRVYVVGHSNGAMLAQRLGCEHSGRVAAVVSVAGSLAVQSCAPALPVAMLEIHGSADNQVSMSAALEAVDVWRVADGCQAAADVTTVGPVATKIWHCGQGADVGIVQIAGAQHPWPGGRTPPPMGQVASAALDASEVAWTFLSRHTRT